MLVLVHGNGFELERELRSDVQEKIEMALGRFESLIGKVNVHLADLNGPKKGIDKSIRVVIDVQRQPLIVVKEKGENWQAVLESISDRATHTLARQLDRVRSKKGRVSMAGDHDSSDQEPSDDSVLMKEYNEFDNVWHPAGVRSERLE